MTKDAAHRIQLHDSLVWIIFEYLLVGGGKTLRSTSALDLMIWSVKQLEKSLSKGKK
jgi:hypothetical protein